MLGKAGLLRGNRFTCTHNTYEQFNQVFDDAIYTGSDIEVENNFITAKGTAFAKFTVEVGNLLGIWREREQADWALQFCKGNI